MQVKLIKEGVLVDTAFSASFVGRLHEMLAWVVKNQDPAAVAAANEKLTNGVEELDEWEEHYVTLLTLIDEIEQAADSQGKTEVVEHTF